MGLRRINVGGRIINRRTYQMLKAAADLLGVRSIPITQGSYNPGKVAASGGTHDKGGVLDTPATFDGRRSRRVVWALRVVGFAAWYRPDMPHVWDSHIHAVAIGDPELAEMAAAQVGAYRRGEDGLAGDGLDNGPRLAVIRQWENVRALPPVVVENILEIARHPDRKLYKRQVRAVQRALRMKVASGLWGKWTERAWRRRFGNVAVNRRDLATLSVGRYYLLDLEPE